MHKILRFFKIIQKLNIYKVKFTLLTCQTVFNKKGCLAAAFFYNPLLQIIYSLRTL